jgi:hypothetical protein
MSWLREFIIGLKGGIIADIKIYITLFIILLLVTGIFALFELTI